METSEILERISCGEDSRTQFKEKLTNAKELAKEMVAFSNALGGIIIVGVSDSASIIGLETSELEQASQLIGNCANENIKPPIHPLTEIRIIDEKKILIIIIANGENKPYSTSSGDYYTKSSADKKKISQEALRRLFAESKNLFADEERVHGTDISDINSELFFRFLKKDDLAIFDALKHEQMDFRTVLENRELLKSGQLTLAGNLLFGLNPQKFTPSFYIDCVYFDGNDVSVDRYISKDTIKGTFEKMYTDSINFIKSNLVKRQMGNDFNSSAQLEIDERVLSELIVNALVHRDYYINSSIKIFIFHNRIEIKSPGKLTNSLTVEKIKSGLSIHRNPILNSVCKNLLPYSGYGSGIKRVLSINPDIEFENNVFKEEFLCLIPRD